jgi:hypothetical protein
MKAGADDQSLVDALDSARLKALVSMLRNVGCIRAEPVPLVAPGHLARLALIEAIGAAT